MAEQTEHTNLHCIETTSLSILCVLSTLFVFKPLICYPCGWALYDGDAMLCRLVLSFRTLLKVSQGSQATLLAATAQRLRWLPLRCWPPALMNGLKHRLCLSCDHASCNPGSGTRHHTSSCAQLEGLACLNRICHNRICHS